MRKGDSERARRFEALFAAHSADIVAYCGWRTASAGDGQDAVAEVFLAAWRRLDEIPDGDGERVWLYATARHVMANQRRSHRRRVALHERLALETTPVFDEQPAPSAEEALVHEALRRLGPRDREVLLLAEWENLSPAEIGTVLGCLTVTARGRLHRARSRFRAVFEELAGAARHERQEPRTSADADGLHLLRPTAALRAATPFAKEEHGSV